MQYIMSPLYVQLCLKMQATNISRQLDGTFTELDGKFERYIRCSYFLTQQAPFSYHTPSLSEHLQLYDFHLSSMFIFSRFTPSINKNVQKHSIIQSIPATLKTTAGMIYADIKHQPSHSHYLYPVSGHQIPISF